MKNLFLCIIALLIFISCNDDKKEPIDKSKAVTDLQKNWWKEAVIYQIYPRSFKDTDGDGVGDLKGIIQKLDYIDSLGVNMVWLNPIYSSPNADNGYDISNYRQIMDEFGSMEDFDIMLSEMHKRDIKFVMDVVVNHSSDEHKWFQESRKSRDNPYRDYYHWWPAEKGEPNYRYSLFDPKGEAWKYDSITNAYYLHYFSQKQPDLNWENPKVRQEVYDIMKFWAEKGVDGFRLDAFQFVSKDTTFPALPKGYEKEVIKYYGMGPNLHKYLKELNKEVLSKYGVFAVSEGAGSNFEDAHSIVDADRKELQMAYHFEGMDVGNSLEAYKLSEFKEVYTKWDSAFAKEGWLSIFLANHDVPRMVSKFGNDSEQYRSASAKMLNTFILTMRGTPYCYYGDELGMTNISFDSIEQYQDIIAKNGYQKTINEGGDIEEYMAKLKFLSRDNGRTPMQWNDTEHAGFTNGTPWLPVNDNYKTLNVEAQKKDSFSSLNYFREMVKFRMDNPVLVYGDYQLLLPEHKQVYAYTRELEDKKMLILLNFSTENIDLSVPGDIKLSKVLKNNMKELEMNANNIHLQPYQALIFSLK